MSGQLDDNELVNIIETYPILYDKDSARGMKNASRKDAAWKAISQKLGASERACITRWKSIRDRFGKEFRRFQEHPHEPTYWDMFPRLLFLKDHYKHGQVKHECLVGIKFEPKERRKKPRLQYAERERKLEDEDELDAEEIELNQQLIELVKMYPVLYDRQMIRDSKNLSAKNDAWRAISGSLQVSEELCYNRWKKLRDRFAREYRNHQINHTAPINWRYFNELSFLAEHYRKGVPLVLENLKKRGRPPKNQSDATANTVSVISVVPGEQVWGADYPYSEDNDELDNGEHYEEAQDDDIEVISEAEQETRYIPLDEFIQDTAPQQQEEQQQQLSQHILVTQQLEDPAPCAQTEYLESQHLVASSATSAMSEPIFPTQNFTPKSEEHLVEATNIATLNTDEPPAAEKLIGNMIVNMETVLRQSKDCLQALQNQNERHQQELQATSTALLARTSVLSKAQMLLDGLNSQQRRNAERKIVQFLCECQIKTLDGEEIEDLRPCQVYN